jgi:hypothetical protein
LGPKGVAFVICCLCVLVSSGSSLVVVVRCHPLSSPSFNNWFCWHQNCDYNDVIVWFNDGVESNTLTTNNSISRLFRLFLFHIWICPFVEEVIEIFIFNLKK